MLKEEECNKMSILFKMLMQPVRLEILSLLFVKECCVNEMVEKLGLDQSRISHQLSILKSNRIIKDRREGRNIYYSLRDKHIENIYKMAQEHVNE
ncbi:MAG: metalloregulator ArsR/SmtB family transcription factor [Erysipelotrichaceae bacterium]